MADVKMMKLVSSEEIICGFVRETDDAYVVQNPYCIAPSLSPSAGKVTVYPWSLAAVQPSDKEFEIKKAFVMLFTDAPESLSGSYIAQTTGLAVPESGLVTG